MAEIDESNFIDLTDYYKEKKLIKSAYRQTLFRELATACCTLDTRKIIHMYVVIFMMLNKLDKNHMYATLGQDYEETHIKKVREMKKNIPEMWSLLDAFGFTTSSPKSFIGTDEFKRCTELEIKLMQDLDILVEVYAACVSEPNFVKWSIPADYLAAFDFYKMLGATKFAISNIVPE